MITLIVTLLIMLQRDNYVDINLNEFPSSQHSHHPRYFALSTTALKEYSINVGKWEAPDPDHSSNLDSVYVDPYGGTGEHSELVEVEREVRQLL